MDEEITIDQVIDSLMDYKLENTYTAIPAVILAVKNNGSQMLVDVQPLVSIKTTDGVVTPQATVLNVPLQMPASSVSGMIFTVKPKDQVLLVYSMMGIDTWKYGQGEPSPASDGRMFDKKDCIAIPCIYPANMAIANPSRKGGSYELGDVAVYNGLDGNHVEIVLKKNGDVIVNSPGKVVVNCVDSEVNASNSTTYTTNSFKINCSSYEVTSSSYKVNTGSYALAAGAGGATTTGVMNMSGSFVLNGIVMESHTHGGVESGGSNTGGPH